jgi:hypothetical protein
MIMVGSQFVAGEDVKGEDRERGDADREVKNVKHADELHQWHIRRKAKAHSAPCRQNYRI